MYLCVFVDMNFWLGCLVYCVECRCILVVSCVIFVLCCLCVVIGVFGVGWLGSGCGCVLVMLLGLLWLLIMCVCGGGGLVVFWCCCGIGDRLVCGCGMILVWLLCGCLVLLWLLLLIWLVWVRKLVCLGVSVVWVWLKIIFRVGINGVWLLIVKFMLRMSSLCMIIDRVRVVFSCCDLCVCGLGVGVMWVFIVVDWF